MLDRLCRFYQSLFGHGHPEEAALVRLHAAGAAAGRWDDYLRAYFDHEYAKGKAALDRFAAVTTEWVGGRALDFGAGGGGLTCRIRERVREAVGIDIEKDKLDFARAEAARRGLTGIEFVHYAGGTPVPLPDGSFDCVFCIDVVEHLPTPERFVAEFRRLLKPGGLLLLSFGPPWGHPHGKHMWAKLPGWWTHLLFPRRTVMRLLGNHPDTTYEHLGLFRLTVGRYDRILRQSGFETVYEKKLIAKPLTPLKYVPLVRELFVAEVVGVYRNPAAGSPLPSGERGEGRPRQRREVSQGPPLT